MKMKSRLLLFFVFPALLWSCSSLDKKAETPEGAYAIAEEFEKDDRFDEALRRYQDVKNKFPYSSYATKAELAIADVHFKDEAYPEAQVAYQAFKELHPRHPQIDYVQFRIALSYYKQLPDSIDRDLTLATDAINNFDDLIRDFPQSSYVKEATEKRAECVQKLAEKEDYIGDFYFKREQYLAAYFRYDGLLSKFPGTNLEARALSRAAISAHKSSHEDKAKDYFSQLKQKYSGSAEFDEARKVLE
jgi:outer membrane protein assembly factor BamD